MSAAVVANDATKAGAVYYAKPSKSCLQSLGVSGLSCLTASSRFQGRLETVTLIASPGSTASTDTARSVSGLRDEVDWNWGLSVKVLVSNVPRFNLSGLEGLSFQVNPSDPSVDIDITWMEVRGSVRFLCLKLLSNLLRGRETEMGLIYIYIYYIIIYIYGIIWIFWYYCKNMRFNVYIYNMCVL